MEKEKVLQTEDGKKRGKMGLRVPLLACMAALMTCASALATDGASGSGDLSAVTGAMSTLTSLVNSVFSMLTGNPLLVLFLAAGLLGVGIRVFTKLRGAAGGGKS